MRDSCRRRAAPATQAIARLRALGFEPLETPAVENLECCSAAMVTRAIIIFKILAREHERRQQAPALRYDLTVPLARVIAYHNRSRVSSSATDSAVGMIGPAGRFREFYQCDVDASARRSGHRAAPLCLTRSSSSASRTS
jgi:histidyl-tRNA synthetase